MRTTNNKTLDLQPVKLNRRAAFAEVSKMLPVAYRGLMRSAGLGHSKKTEDREERAIALLGASDFVARGTQFLAGQFAARIIRTRAKLEADNGGQAHALEVFAAHTLGRLLFLQECTLDGFAIQAADIPAKALAMVEGDLASVIFAALAHEAEDPDFEEEDFWPDVFRGIADADNTRALVLGFQPVFLDHTDEWRHSLRLAAGGHVLDFLPARPTAH